ncbi:MAG: VWA domain-containing protein [Gammaproteobacteria bacterium]|nr:VWA domain-containing protein [Gammaproteobacteria bacterium]
MIAFLWPWLFLLLPLPLLARWLLPASNSLGGPPLRVPFFNQLSELSGQHSMGGLWNQRLLPPLLIWLLLVTSAAQPVWLGDNQPQPTTGRDLMLLIDISGSMRHMDFRLHDQPAERLQVVQQVASEFVDQRRGDRLGLILFGSQPFLRAPLSHDRATIKALLQESEVALAGEYTAIGDAIGLGIKRMHGLKSDSRVMILLSDGANNEGRIPPRQAAEIAATKGIRIYTIGVGAMDTPGPNPFGIWSSDNSERFERQVLEDMAEITQGQFFHALDTQGLQEAYAELNRLEPALGDAVDEYISTPLYTWSLAAALLLSAVLSIQPWFRQQIKHRRRAR